MISLSKQIFGYTMHIINTQLLRLNFQVTACWCSAKNFLLTRQEAKCGQVTITRKHKRIEGGKLELNHTVGNRKSGMAMKPEQHGSNVHKNLLSLSSGYKTKQSHIPKKLDLDSPYHTNHKFPVLLKPKINFQQHRNPQFCPL